MLREKLNIEGVSKLVIQDRFTRGFLAGVFAGVIMAVLDYIAFSLDLLDLMFIHWASVMLLGYGFRTFWEGAISQGGHLIFSGILGIIFAYILLGINDDNHLLKGWVFGMFVWFSAHAIIKLFSVEALMPIRISSLVSDAITASIYGLVLAETLRRLEKTPKKN